MAYDACDVNRDGIVNVEDVTVAIAVICSVASNPLADVDGNGVVDVNDITKIISTICGE